MATTPSNVSNLLDFVDQYVDALPKDMYSNEEIATARRVGKSLATRLMTDMINKYGNVSGYSVRNQGTFGRVDIDKTSTVNRDNLVTTLNGVFNMHRGTIISAVTSLINTYLSTLHKFANNESIDQAAELGEHPKGWSTWQGETAESYIDDVLNPNTHTVALAHLGYGRYRAPDGRVVCLVDAKEAEKMQKQKQQETLFDTNSDFQDAFNKITEPVDNKVTNEDVAQYLSEELGHLYGADTALEMCRQIVDGRATVTITHRYDEKTAKGTAHYAISGEVELP